METRTDVWIVIAVALCCFTFAILAAFEERARRERAARNIVSLADKVLGGVDPGEPRLYVYDDASGLIVTNTSVHAVNLRGEGSLLQRYELSHIAALKVYEDRKNNMAFRLVTKNQSETRSIRLQGAVTITKLFDRLSAVGVELLYVPEEL
jgi:hypothetical protein